MANPRNQPTTDAEREAPAHLKDTVRYETQAERVLELFRGLNFEGRRFRTGFAALAYAIRLVGGSYTRGAIYKWTWSGERGGTDGIIPARALPWVEKAARVCGVLIPPGIMDPRGQYIKVRTPRTGKNRNNGLLPIPSPVGEPSDG